MNADNIKRMRKLACEVNETGRGETCLLMIEACDELERLGSIEAAAIALMQSTAYDDASLNSMCDRVSELREIIEANPCPTK